jgi:hypothetical protein
MLAPLTYPLPCLTTCQHRCYRAAEQRDQPTPL